MPCIINPTVCFVIHTDAVIVLFGDQSFSSGMGINEVLAGFYLCSCAHSEWNNAVFAQLRLLKLLCVRVLVSRGRQQAGERVATSRQAEL